MAKTKTQEPPAKKEAPKAYQIKRFGSGYAIFSATGDRLTEPNVFQITSSQLMERIRKDLGI